MARWRLRRDATKVKVKAQLFVCTLPLYTLLYIILHLLAHLVTLTAIYSL
jgi:hypothetical protein